MTFQRLGLPSGRAAKHHPIFLCPTRAPFIAKVGLGRLPGDIVYHRGNTTFYFPIVTSIILSVVLSAVLWLLGR